MCKPHGTAAAASFVAAIPGWSACLLAGCTLNNVSSISSTSCSELDRLKGRQERDLGPRARRAIRRLAELRSQRDTWLHLQSVAEHRKASTGSVWGWCLHACDGVGCLIGGLQGGMVGTGPGMFLKRFACHASSHACTSECSTDATICPRRWSTARL